MIRVDVNGGIRCRKRVKAQVDACGRLRYTPFTFFSRSPIEIRYRGPIRGYLFSLLTYYLLYDVYCKRKGVYKQVEYRLHTVYIRIQNSKWPDRTVFSVYTLFLFASLKGTE